ncbi:hypothetical protein C1X69_30170 [Pseudomonas sp. FW305-67]|nr:hypothetical protein C1X67_25730 [Pseudomonas sp. FW305-62]PNA39075.1 hypothetical protein C1X71_27460 [Pseudomonas sp. FW306-2-2C-A10BC]PNA82409.1 hypothetical protein C1X66_26805 [Pseudomonas sp. MPR-R3B]PNB07605.1 hypothetical protein C1X69_30170 [Pseudomonas sp. FW305-67]
MVEIMTIGLLAFIIILCLLGIMCLFFSEKTQGIIIKLIDRAGASKKYPLKSLIRSSNYLYILRSVGALALLMSFFLTWGLINNL